MSIVKMKKIAKRYYENNLADEMKAHGTLLFLSMSGSHLYGCDRPESDIDIKGVFLPYKNNVLCYEHPKSINRKGEIDGIDVDFECWSLQYLKHLLYKGDSNVIDMLYSLSYDDAVIHCNPHWRVYFAHEVIKEFILFNKMTGIVGYCNRQAEKYGLKGSRLKEVLEFTKRFNDILTQYTPDDDGNYAERFKVIWEKLQLDKYIHIKRVPLNKIDDGKEAISILGRLIPEYLYLHQITEHVNRISGQFGHRSIEASECDGKDFKAMSHAYRAGVEYLNILKNGRIDFPLKESKYILSIKQGNCDFEKTKSEIADMLEEIAKIDDGTVFERNKPSIKYLNRVILEFYSFPEIPTSK
jgi:hypothetical protein